MRAARLSGLPVAGVTVLAYALSGFFGALAGIALAGALRRLQHPCRGRVWSSRCWLPLCSAAPPSRAGAAGSPARLPASCVLVIAFNLVNISGLPYHMQLVVMGAIIILASAVYGQISDRAG